MEVEVVGSGGSASLPSFLVGNVAVVDVIVSTGRLLQVGRTKDKINT